MTKTMIPPDPQSGDDQPKPSRWFATGQLHPEPVQPPFEPRVVVSPSAPPLPKRAVAPGGRHRSDSIDTKPATLAAERVLQGHLDQAERAAIAAVFHAFSLLKKTWIMPTPIMATLITATDLLAGPRLGRQAADAESVSDSVRDGVE